ncbi:septal ring lytic transglycosylase RlpA family protein [Candidatus Poribacteria bacterium]|nr:septal ring lytic transglycosylase RlpA family protein [Candidatus Poribacteria bacterium]
MKFVIYLQFLLFFVIIISGCTSRSSVRAYNKPYAVDGRQYYPVIESKGFIEEGLASWYGKDFHGKKTSSGEIYDMNLKTAAHKTLPLGTYVKVKNIENGRITVVRINDRGPFVKGRIIDLSYAIACELGIDISGTAKVRIEALDRDDVQSISIKNFSIGNFTIQVGAFKNKENADRLVERLKNMYESTHCAVFNSGNEIFYRVRVGKFNQLSNAYDAQEELDERGYKEAMVIAE